jgi:hypothetical protein
MARLLAEIIEKKNALMENESIVELIKKIESDPSMEVRREYKSRVEKEKEQSIKTIRISQALQNLTLLDEPKSPKSSKEADLL